jgi:hypothetical protein
VAEADEADRSTVGGFAFFLLWKRLIVARGPKEREEVQTGASGIILMATERRVSVHICESWLRPADRMKRLRHHEDKGGNPCLVLCLLILPPSRFSVVPAATPPTSYRRIVYTSVSLLRDATDHENSTNRRSSFHSDRRKTVYFRLSIGLSLERRSQ